MPNGGMVCMNTVPGLFIADENGPHTAIEPRHLTTFRGHRLTLNAAQEAQAAGQHVVRAWVKHVCPPRPQNAPARQETALPVPSSERQENTPQPELKEEQRELF